jgi:hypothetical protein
MIKRDIINNFFIDQKLIDDFDAKIEYFSSTYMFFSKIMDCQRKLKSICVQLPAIGKFGYDRLYTIK